MKKMLSIVLVLMLIGLAIPLALADEAEDGVEIDEETQEEVDIMGNKTGAKIRLLQLEKSISRNIVKGEYIVSFLNDTNTSLLEAIIAELNFVKEEVQSSDPNSSDAVQTFVDLKGDAIELSKDFRDTLHTLIDNETIEDLKDETKGLVNGSVENLGQRIRNCVRLYNGNQLHKMYGYLGTVNESLIEGYKNGNCSMEQVKQNISKMVNKLTKQERYQVFSEMKESKIRKGVQAHQCVANATEGFQERKQNRIQNRLNNTQGMANGLVKQQMQQYLSDKLGGHNGNSQNQHNGGE